jgi:nucleoid DNA-binding protein
VNKTDIIDAVCAKLGVETTKADATELVDVTFEEIMRGLAQHGTLMISGFGRFRVLDKGARRGRNPKTGEPILIAARQVVTFSASNVLKGKIKEHIDLID